MKKKIVTVGNSAGITISPAELRELNLNTGDPVDVVVQSGVLEVKPVNKYEGLNLNELVEIIDARRTRQ